MSTRIRFGILWITAFTVLHGAGCGKKSPSGTPDKPVKAEKPAPVDKPVPMTGIRFIALSAKEFVKETRPASGFDSLLQDVSLPSIPSKSADRNPVKADAVLRPEKDGTYSFFLIDEGVRMEEAKPPLAPELRQFKSVSEQFERYVCLFRIVEELLKDPGSASRAAREIVDLGPAVSAELNALISDREAYVRRQIELCRFNAKTADEDLATLEGEKKKYYSDFMDRNRELEAILKGFPETLPGECVKQLEEIYEEVKITLYHLKYLDSLKEAFKRLKAKKEDVKVGLFLDREASWDLACRITQTASAPGLSLLTGVAGKEAPVAFLDIRFEFTIEGDPNIEVMDRIEGKWNKILKKTKYYMNGKLLGYGEKGIAKLAGMDIQKKKYAVYLPENTSYGEVLILLVALTECGAAPVFVE